MDLKKRIGVSTSAFSSMHWRKELDDYNLVELNRRWSDSIFQQSIIDKIKILKKKYSLHTQNAFLFGSEKKYHEVTNSLLKAEVLFAKEIGAKEIIVHIQPKKLSKKEILEFKKLYSYAKRNGVEIVVENAWASTVKCFSQLIDEFPELRFNLDLGHLNIQLYNNHIPDIESFLNLLKGKISYMHIHGNNGTKDQHIRLSKSTLDLKKVFSLIELRKVKKFIIEVHDKKEIKPTIRKLKKLLK